MLFKALAVILAIGSVWAMTPLESRIHSESMLMDLIMMPRVGDPVVQQYCFNHYIPILKQLNDDFMAEYTQCQTTFDNSAKWIDAAYQEQRANATYVSKTSCETLQACDRIETYAEAFDCFGSVGQGNSQNLSAMAGNSTLSAVQIREKYSVVASQRNACFVASQNNYNKNQIATTNQLQKCLDGEFEVPEETTTHDLN